MNLNFDFDCSDEDRLVYISKIDPIEVPDEYTHHIQNGEDLFAIHSLDGTQIAITGDRQSAFDLAQINDLVPHSVH